MLDFSLVKRELLVTLRGGRSHTEMSQLVGFTFNQWHKWETEQKWLRWDEFIDILIKIDHPVEKIFTAMFSLTENPREFKTMVDTLCTGVSTKQIAEILDQEEETIKRWLRSGVSPSVETVFKLIDRRQNNFSEFIAQIVPIEKVESLNSIFKLQNAHKTVEVRYPFSAAIEACLNLEDYKKTPQHSTAWISKRTLISEALVESAVQDLEKSGTIKKNGDHYVLVHDWVQMNGVPLKEAVKVDRHWTQRALDRYSGPDQIPYVPVDRVNTNMRSYRVTALSTEAALQIQEKLRQVSQEILNIALNDNNPKTEIKVFITHYFDVQDVHWKMTE